MDEKEKKFNHKGPFRLSFNKKVYGSFEEVPLIGLQISQMLLKNEGTLATVCLENPNISYEVFRQMGEWINHDANPEVAYFSALYITYNPTGSDSVDEVLDWMTKYRRSEENAFEVSVFAMLEKLEAIFPGQLAIMFCQNFPFADSIN